MVDFHQCAHPSLRKVLEAVHRVHAIRDLRTLPGVMLQVANELTPCNLATFDAINLTTGETTSFFDRPSTMPMDEFARRWNRLCHEHPAIKYLEGGGTGTVFSLSDFISDREFRRLSLYNELFREFQLTAQIAMVLPVPGFIVGIAVNRQGKFGDEDREMLTLLQPHLGLAYENAVLLSSIQNVPEIDYTKWRNRGLTLRQCEVLRWLVEGKRDAEIGVILGCRTRTVHTHVGHILAKFGVETRTAAAAEARKILLASKPSFKASIAPMPAGSWGRDHELR